MKLALPALVAQTALLLLLAPLLSGLIKNWKAKLQNRRGPQRFCSFAFQFLMTPLSSGARRSSNNSWKMRAGILMS